MPTCPRSLGRRSTTQPTPKNWRVRSLQKCRYYDYKDLGAVDYGAQRFQCDHGMYTLEVGQSHLFEWPFYSLKADEEVTFRYSDKLLMRPEYVGEAMPQDANPAYYLEPMVRRGTPHRGVPRPSPPPRPPDPSSS